MAFSLVAARYTHRRAGAEGPANASLSWSRTSHTFCRLVRLRPSRPLRNGREGILARKGERGAFPPLPRGLACAGGGKAADHGMTISFPPLFFFSLGGESIATAISSSAIGPFFPLGLQRPRRGRGGGGGRLWRLFPLRLAKPAGEAEAAAGRVINDPPCKTFISPSAGRTDRVAGERGTRQPALPSFLCKGRKPV